MTREQLAEIDRRLSNITAELAGDYEREIFKLNGRVAALLRTIQWNSYDPDGPKRDGADGECCPFCYGFKAENGAQHDPACELATLLRECEAAL